MLRSSERHVTPDTAMESEAQTASMTAFNGDGPVRSSALDEPGSGNAADSPVSGETTIALRMKREITEWRQWLGRWMLVPRREDLNPISQHLYCIVLSILAIVRPYKAFQVSPLSTCLSQ